MKYYPDTSYLCAVYRQQVQSPRALAFHSALTDPVPFTSLLEFEFLQSLRLQVFLHQSDASRGFAKTTADNVTAMWQSDIAAGLVKQVSYDAEAVNKLAGAYSDLYSMRGGHRSLDLLHVATAVHLGARSFLTFDARQKTLAKQIGLAVPF